MGDDLKIARRFCDTIRADISALIEGVSAPPFVALPTPLIHRLASIQSEAKIAHARGIYRAAQTVIDGLNDDAPLATVQGRVLSLKTLATQYEQGLDEIAPKPANVAATVQDVIAPEVRVSEDAEVICTDVAMTARYDAAREALRPLMAFAQPAEREALNAVAGFDAIAQAPAQIYRSPEMVDFETLMPGFTSHALHCARQCAKTVSVSYSCEGAALSRGQAHAMQAVLAHIAETFVSGVLEPAETRRARGENGAGHIALTAKSIGEQVSVSIDCPSGPLLASASSASVSTAPLSVSAFIPPLHSVAGFNMTPGENMQNGLCHIVLSLSRSENAVIKSRSENAVIKSQRENTAITPTNTDTLSELAL